MKSHPDWEKLNQAANDLAIAINPQVFFWGFDEQGQPTIIDEVERLATVEKVKEAIAVHLEGGRFADWINANFLMFDTLSTDQSPLLPHQDDM